MKVIAIDGPAGSGKSTVARRLAEHLGLEYLDTGAMYRAVTFAALRRGVDRGGDPARLQLQEPPLGAHPRRGRQEELRLGVGEHHRADVPPLEHRARRGRASPEPLLQAEERVAHHRPGAEGRGRLAHLRAADRGGHVPIAELHLAAQPEAQGLGELGQELREAGVVVERHAALLRREGRGPVDRPGVHQGQPHPRRELARDGALARAGGSVDGDDHWAAFQASRAFTSRSFSFAVPTEMRRAFGRP